MAGVDQGPITSLQGQVVLVTGAASGIGRATAAQLYAAGALLSLADNNYAGLVQVAAELAGQGREREGPGLATGTAASEQSSGEGSEGVQGGGGGVGGESGVEDGDLPQGDGGAGAGAGAGIMIRQLDVRQEDSVRQWVLDTLRHFDAKELAGCANLAGVFGASIAQERGAIRNVSTAEFNWVMDVNCRGLFHCLRAQLPYMRCGRGGRGGGAIVNAASIAALGGVEYNAPYVASKHAVLGLTRTAAKEEGARAIRVNCIAPGIIATPMISAIEHAKGSTNLFGDTDPGALARKGDAAEVARVVCWLLSDHASFVNGAVVTVDGGWFC